MNDYMECFPVGLWDCGIVGLWDCGIVGFSTENVDRIQRVKCEGGGSEEKGGKV